MSYVQGLSRDETMLLPASVDDYVSDENPVRALDAFVDSLDLQEIGFELRDEEVVGRPGYHPATLLKLYLWGYFNRVRSSRQLEKACTENLNVIWLTGNLRPDHSTISDFRKHHPQALQQIFREFNLLCIKLGLFGKELIGIDGAFVKAVNGKARSYTKTKITKLLETINESITSYLEQLESTDKLDNETGSTAEESSNSEALRDKIDRMEERRKELGELLKKCGDSETGQVNLTDPDSRQLRKKGQHTVGYNVQSAVDDKHHLVASCEVTQDPTDMHQLDRMAQQAKDDMGLDDDETIKALADKGYCCPAEISACQKHNTETFVPVPKTQPAGDGTVKDEDFLYQPESDTYRCPQGKVLPRKADDVRDTGNSFQVYYEAKQCRDCPLLGRCTKGKYRKFKVSIHKEAMDGLRERNRANPKLYAKRRALAEHPFGTIKEWGADLLCRGLELAKAETRLSFWAYNFKRVINVLGVKNLIAAIQG